MSIEREIAENIARARSVDGMGFESLQSSYSSVGALIFDRTYTDDRRSEEWIIYYDASNKRHTMSFETFGMRVMQVARYLHRSGVGKGDRVAVLGHNHDETVLQYFACWYIGATVVPLNAGEDDLRLRYILENSGARLLFLREEYCDRETGVWSGIRSLKTIVYCADGTPADTIEHAERFQGFFSEILETGDAAPLLPRIHLLDHEALIVYTSGTTGPPKGVVLSHGNMLADGRGIADWHGVESGTTMMCVLPIHHVNGTIVTLVTPYLVGGRVVLNRRFSPSRFFDRLATEGVEIVSVVPTLLAYLCSADIDISSLDLSRFRHLICGAGPLTCELALRFEDQYSMRIIHGYGLSETTCYSCFLPVDLSPSEHRSWVSDHGFPSIGVAIPQNEMAIHDDRGATVSVGHRGEIVIRGHNVMKGYFNNPGANASTFEHGWFRSGDEGFYLEDNAGRAFFFITGRLKELIIRGGINLSPLEIDEVLNAHPGVDAAIAVGFENTWYGEEIGALVRRSDPDLTEESLLDWIAERLPFAKRPKAVVFGDDIPVTSTGKYQRSKVRDLFTQHRETQFREE